MKNISLVSIGLLSGAFLLLESGCSSTTTVNSVENAQTVAQRKMLAEKCIITDRSLNNAVRVLDINSSTSPAGYLKIQVKVLNRTSSLKRFSYRVEWYDQNGIIINLPTASAIPMAIEGKDIIPLVQVAPTPMAKDFRIKFIEPTK